MSLFEKSKQKIVRPNVWARPEMEITFRAQLMPGKSCEDRTFRIEKVLSNGRVVLYNREGEHRESEFEPINFKRK